MVIVAGLLHAAFRRLAVRSGLLSLRVFLEPGVRARGPCASGSLPSYSLVADAMADGASRERRRSGPIMHLFINSLAASAGGGLTYIRNVIASSGRHTRRAGHRRARSRPAGGVSEIHQRRFCGVGRSSVPADSGTSNRSFRESSGGRRPDVLLSAGKLCLEKLARAANLAFAQFHLHLGGFLSGLALPPRISLLARYSPERPCWRRNRFGGPT